VSTTPVANLPPVLKTPAVNFLIGTAVVVDYSNFSVWKFFPFATGDAPWAANISVNLWKNLKQP
jgi:hypothetical protein